MSEHPKVPYVDWPGTDAVILWRKEADPIRLRQLIVRCDWCRDEPMVGYIGKHRVCAQCVQKHLEKLR